MKKKSDSLIKSIALLILIFCFIANSNASEDENKSGKSTIRNKNEEIITNSIGMKLRRIKPGEFIMGQSEKCEDWEKPAHKVKITKTFYIGVYEVTQEEWVKVMGKDNNPSEFKGARLPVDSISWEEAQEFCKKLSDMEDGKYRLPTEAEWEYACRSGSSTIYYWGDTGKPPMQEPITGKMISEGTVSEFAWYNQNSKGKTHEVGQKKPNAWGLYDMSGNVYEWCQDWYSDNYYENSDKEDPQGPSEGNKRVLRGGPYSGDLNRIRSANRESGPPAATCDSKVGLRVVCIPEE